MSFAIASLNDTDSEYEDLDRDDEVGNDEMWYARRGPRNDLGRIEDPYKRIDISARSMIGRRLGRYNAGSKSQPRFSR
jgi:hypothetical protein